LGEKIIIFTNRPSLVVGSKGSNIRDLTKALKKEFNLENPQIEISEVKDVFLDAHLVAQKIANSLERFGSARFKSIGHKIMENVMNSGALGIELIISGKIPSARAKSWRFYQGYLKKCGDLATQGVRHAQASALLKSGVIGIKVSIMPPDIELPDHVDILDEALVIDAPADSEDKTKKKSVKTAHRASPKKKTIKKKKEKTDEKNDEAPASEPALPISTQADTSVSENPEAS
jgi:small subunit ribosomal protein S3